MKINIKEINTSLFTRVSITDYGVRFEHFNHELYEQMKHKDPVKQLWIITVHLLHDGGMNFTVYHNVGLNSEQIDEIMRVREILKEG